MSKTRTMPLPNALSIPHELLLLVHRLNTFFAPEEPVTASVKFNELLLTYCYVVRHSPTDGLPYPGIPLYIGTSLEEAMREVRQAIARWSERNTNPTIEVPLNAGLTAVIDLVDSDLLGYAWSLSRSKTCRSVYVQRQISRTPSKAELMHRVILARMLGRDLTAKEQVDHINSNGLDNRRCNLRLATSTQNARNRRRHSNNTSGYKGVSWDTSTRKWLAQIWHDGGNLRLGLFDAPEAAHAAYCKAAEELYGEFARME